MDVKKYQDVLPILQGKDIIERVRNGNEYYFYFYSCDTQQQRPEVLREISDSLYYRYWDLNINLHSCSQNTIDSLPEWVINGIKIISFMKEEEVGSIINFYSTTLNVIVFHSKYLNDFTLIDSHLLNQPFNDEAIRSCYYQNPTQFSGNFKTIGDFLRYNNIIPVDIEAGSILN